MYLFQKIEIIFVTFLLGFLCVSFEANAQNNSIVQQETVPSELVQPISTKTNHFESLLNHSPFQTQFSGAYSKSLYKSKKIVLISGDEEYRSEEMLTQWAKILAVHHGFDTVVLYPVHKETGLIDPLTQDNIPGLNELRNADLMVIFTRFRNLPDEQMKEINDYLRSGRPVLGIRTATHAFAIPTNRKFAHYSFDFQGNEEKSNWNQGFGRKILGETWINHHGNHGVEATRGIVSPDEANHPILNGVNNIFGPTDVYSVRLPLPNSCRPLVFGQVLKGMSATDEPVSNEKNNPMLPIAWIKTYSFDDENYSVNINIDKTDVNNPLPLESPVSDNPSNVDEQRSNFDNDCCSNIADNGILFCQTSPSTETNNPDGSRKSSNQNNPNEQNNPADKNSSIRQNDSIGPNVSIKVNVSIESNVSSTKNVDSLTQMDDALGNCKVFVSTMGSGEDFQNEGFRRLLINAVYWLNDLEDQIPDAAIVDLVGEYHPNSMGFGQFKKNIAPDDWQIIP